MNAIEGPIITADFIDQIYEAAVLADLWPDVLERIAGLSGADRGGIVSAATPHFSGWKATPVMQPLIAEYLASEVAGLNPRAARSLQLNHAGFLSDDDLFTREEMDQDPFYRWARERGAGWCFGTTIQVADGDALAFGWERSFDLGPFDPALVRSFDPLRPHLARASLVAARLTLERAHAAVEALALLRLPAAVVTLTQRLMAANELLEILVPDQIQDRAKRLTLTDGRADSLLGQALAALSSATTSEQVSSIPVSGVGDHPPAIAHVVPLRGGARDIFPSSLCLLVLTPMTRSNVPAAQIVQALFDLTPAEARVAVAIASGKTQEQVAASAGLSVNTVKTQLRAVFSKTGVSKQAHLVALLTGMTLPR
jgi:DNA-binding CsgD family transcriptional regulator